MKRLFLSSILLLSFMTAVSVAAQAADIPKYLGVIKPITSPIVLRYRPFPKSPFTQTKHVSIPNDVGDNSNQTQMSGFVESQLVDGFLIITMTSEDRGGIFIQLSLTQSGQFQGLKMEIKGKEFPSSSSSELKTLIKQLEDVMKSANPIYDKVNGYVTGDSIFDVDLDMNIMNFEMTVKTHGVVRGLTVYEGRDALVTDFEGTISLDGNSGSAGGYMVLDVETGFTVLSEKAMSIPFSLKGRTMQVHIKETQTVKLPPMRNKPVQKVGRSIEERLAKLKELLEKGLLTPDEAAAKRKEILNSL